MKSILLFLSIIIFLLGSCSKDEQLDPTIEILTADTWILYQIEVLTIKNNVLDTISSCQ